jgi:LPXTG-motif cell wall-anchored protein
MKKSLAALALAGSIAFAGAVPALAYTSSPPEIVVDDAAVAPNEPFILSGGGMAPNEPVNVTVTPVDASAPAAGSQVVAAKINVFFAPQTLSTTADADGRFSLPISISEAGTYSITATGAVSGRTVGPVTVQVDPSFAEGGAPLAGTGGNAGGAPLANTGSGLANTGADSGLVLWTLVGAGALAAGATSVVVVRRRAKAEAAA